LRRGQGASRGMRGVAFAVALCLAQAVHAHKASDAYVTIDRAGAALAVRVDVALRDLDLAIGLDANGDGEITWGEVRSRHDAIAALVVDRTKVAVRDRPCPLDVTGHRVDRHSDGAYAVVDLAGRCEGTSGALSIDYRLLFDVDPQHRGLVNVVDEGGSASLVLSAERPRASTADGGFLAQFGAYLREGALHIWAGYDHMLFVLGLLLPAVLVRARGRWVPAERFGPIAASVLGIVTAFTVAHAITLTLATLGFVDISSRISESLVALSIAIAALLNLSPVANRARWVVAFAFGLVHGLGFANVLAALSLSRGVLATALVAFNVGVELGQLAVAAIFLPLAFMLRETRLYRPAILIGGSLVIAALGLAWFAERALDRNLLPG
jgi:hypothetical protein